MRPGLGLQPMPASKNPQCYEKAEYAHHPAQAAKQPAAFTTRCFSVRDESSQGEGTKEETYKRDCYLCACARTSGLRFVEGSETTSSGPLGRRNIERMTTVTHHRRVWA